MSVMTCPGAGGTWPSFKPNSQCESRYFVRLPQSSLWACRRVCSKMPDSGFPCAFQNKCIVLNDQPCQLWGWEGCFHERTSGICTDHSCSDSASNCGASLWYTSGNLWACESGFEAERSCISWYHCLLSSNLSLLCFSFPGILFLTNRTPWRNARTSGVVYHPKKPCCVLGP